MKIMLRPVVVLVVEDSFGDIGLFHEIFSEINGFVLHTALSLVQAQAFLEKRPPFEDAPTPDLVFLDLNMPIAPGYQLLPIIRGDAELKHIKVAIFTSSENSADVRRCRDLGADDYILKPSDWPEWKSAIVAALGRHCGFGR
jgi:CheY-like chemotaxis protein